MDKQTTQPKSTFTNLPEGKRAKIVAVMVREFALNGYRKASLNNIAKDSGVAKGSLYQYFSSKEEMFFYVFDQFTSLVKQSLAERAGELPGGEAVFWTAVKQVLLAGVHFIERWPEYFQLYLRVLFEHDVPRRQELITSVRLFSREYFTPLVEDGQRAQVLRRDLSTDVVVFFLDAVMDRFLQGYAKPYLDGGLGLAAMSAEELDTACDEILKILKGGLQTGSY